LPRLCWEERGNVKRGAVRRDDGGKTDPARDARGHCPAHFALGGIGRHVESDILLAEIRSIGWGRAKKPSFASPRAWLTSSEHSRHFCAGLRAWNRFGRFLQRAFGAFASHREAGRRPAHAGGGSDCDAGGAHALLRVEFHNAGIRVVLAIVRSKGCGSAADDDVPGVVPLLTATYLQKRGGLDRYDGGSYR